MAEAEEGILIGEVIYYWRQIFLLLEKPNQEPAAMTPLNWQMLCT